MHLTNYAINKHAPNYVFGENEDDNEGHKRSLKSLWETLRSKEVDVDKI